MSTNIFCKCVTYHVASVWFSNLQINQSEIFKTIIQYYTRSKTGIYKHRFVSHKILKATTNYINKISTWIILVYNIIIIIYDEQLNIFRIAISNYFYVFYVRDVFNWDLFCKQIQAPYHI